MKLWLISQTENDDYDTFDSAVVAADSEDDAKATHPRFYEDDPDYDWFGTGSHGWVNSPDKVTAELIGEAIEGTVRGVILASFNAG